MPLASTLADSRGVAVHGEPGGDRIVAARCALPGGSEVFGGRGESVVRGGVPGDRTDPAREPRARRGRYAGWR